MLSQFNSNNLFLLATYWILLSNHEGNTSYKQVFLRAFWSRVGTFNNLKAVKFVNYVELLMPFLTKRSQTYGYD